MEGRRGVSYCSPCCELSVESCQTHHGFLTNWPLWEAAENKEEEEEGEEGEEEEEEEEEEGEEEEECDADTHYICIYIPINGCIVT